MARRFVVGGNWKLNGNKQSVAAICQNLSTAALDANTEVIVGVPATHLEFARNALPATIEVAGQVSKSSKAICRLLLMYAIALILTYISSFCRTHGKCQAVRSPVKYLQLC